MKIVQTGSLKARVIVKLCFYAPSYQEKNR